MDTSILEHLEIARVVAAIVSNRGGCVQYDQGGGGREVLIAAGARLAAELGMPLTVVESPVLHDAVAADVAELEPSVSCTILSAERPSELPHTFSGGVLAVHADVLREPAVRQPLQNLAEAAEHLIVIRHAHSDTTLDSLAGPRHVLRVQDLMPPAAVRLLTMATLPETDPPPEHTPVIRLGPEERARLADFWTRVLERKRRWIEQLSTPPTDKQPLDLNALGYTQLAEVTASGTAGVPAPADSFRRARCAVPPTSWLPPWLARASRTLLISSAGVMAWAAGNGASADAVRRCRQRVDGQDR
jgi:hypothetical protein